MNSETLVAELEEKVADNPEWRLCFDSNEQVHASCHPPRRSTQWDSPWFKQPGASRRITPPEAAIPISDDTRVLDAFAAAGHRVPSLLLAGERARHCWDPNEKLRVGVLTTGGNAPGLNMVTDSVTKRHHEYRRHGASPVEVYAYEGGLRGLLAADRCRLALVPSERMQDDPINYTHPVKRERTLVTDEFALEGCTRLKTLRGEIATTPEDEDRIFKKLADAVHAEQLQVLHLVGGDGSMKAAHRIQRKYDDLYPDEPLSVVCCVKTMDNDVVLADPSFGFYTVVDESMDFIRRIAREAESQDRIAVVLLFGAASGFVALYAAYCSGEVDWVLLPEMIPEKCFDQTGDGGGFEPDYIALDPPKAYSPDEYVRELQELRRTMINQIEKRVKLDDKRHAVVVVAEGAVPALAFPKQAAESHSHSDAFRELKARAFGELISQLKDDLAKRGVTNSIMHSAPQHLIRSTGPNAFDAALCKYTGKLLADTALAGYYDCAVSMWHGRPVLVPLELIVGQKKFVQPNSYFAASMLRKLVPTESRSRGDVKEAGDA